MTRDDDDYWASTPTRAYVKRKCEENPPPPLTQEQQDIIAAAFAGSFIRRNGRLMHADGTELDGPEVGDAVT
jgi:hypothetical protein